MKKKILLFTFVLVPLLAREVAQAQNFPFPQSKTYAYGIMAPNRSSSDASAVYNSWKTTYVTTCSNGRYRVKFDDPNQTVSEGIGYGMLLAAYAADRTVLDGLWLYYKDNRNNNGVMNWKINGCSGTIGSNGATDAELDAAMALIVAHYQWGSTGSVHYQSDAQALIGAIKTHEVESGTSVLKPGDVFGGSNLTNPSYFSPGYYRLFGQFTNDATFWNGVATKAYQVINNNLSTNGATNTGLVSDWTKADGSHSSEASGYFSGGTRYHYDACRTPWRIATDYVWYGTADAKTYCTKVANFVKNTLGGSANVKDGYYQNGSVYGQYHNAAFVGGFASAAMAVDNTSDYQTHLSSSYTDLKNTGNDNYFNTTLKALYLFLQTGNFYLPTSSASSLRTPENPASTTAGLHYAYYEGSWSALPNFTNLTAVKTGTVTNVDLTPRNRDDQFAFKYTGFINVPSDGTYTFYTSSDDGSKLLIGSTVVVDNDGLHGAQERSGTIGLKAGKHALTLTFFEQGGGQILSMSYAGPDISKQTVPATALYRSTSTSARIRSLEESKEDFTIYPNPAPAHSHLSIQFTADKAQSVRVVLTDMQARVRTSFTGTVTQGINRMVIPADRLDNLEKGTYMAIIYAKNKEVAKKVVINR